MEKQMQVKRIQTLEEDLGETTKELENAKSQIECEKAELSNLETVRKDLEAQRVFLTGELQDSEIKGICFRTCFAF